MATINEGFNVGEGIKRLRVNKGYTQKDLAVLLGVSIATVAKYENNQTIPGIEMAVKLAQIFGVTIDELVHRTVTAPKKSNSIIDNGINH